MRQSRDSGYWYPSDDKVWGGIDVLNALRRYRAAEVAMRRRTRRSMGMGETDLAAVRFLLEAQARDLSVSPKQLAVHLGISSASTSTLVDRLVRSGHVERTRHASDGRAIVLKATAVSDSEVRSVMGDMHTRMVEVTGTLSPADAAVISAFLERMTFAIDDEGKDADPSRANGAGLS
jgi:DNA-binding MarR family transcriptional regulator